MILAGHCEFSVFNICITIHPVSVTLVISEKDLVRKVGGQKLFTHEIILLRIVCRYGVVEFIIFGLLPF